MTRVYIFVAKAALCALFAVFVSTGVDAQTKRSPVKSRPAVSARPVVTRIDIEGLRTLIKSKGRPLLINFWATWCDPCREEFPDLVKIDEAYKGKIDFVTVSLDDLAEIRTSVPKFLGEMKATMPAYLLKTPDESAAIMLVAKDWSGNLPMTVLIATSGETAYMKSGKVKPEDLKAEIDKVLP
jgi:thiol-disulfide isomerase/thioredoxin